MRIQNNFNKEDLISLIKEVNKKNTPIFNSSEKEAFKNYIINSNNELFSLAKSLNIHIPELVYIIDDEFSDKDKKVVIDNILQEEKKQQIVEDSMRAADIVVDKSIFEEMEKRARELDDNILKKNISRPNKVDFAEAVPPPKTDWKRVDIDKGEKEKIINSIKANPNSNKFSPGFKWDIEEFLGSFKYLESSDKYNGPFIVSIISNKDDLKKYYEIEKISHGIDDILTGEYVLLSMYDITSGHNKSEAKHMFMGLRLNQMTGRLEFSDFGSISGEIRNSQKLLAKEYMDSMDIIYNNSNEDLKTYE